MNLINGWPDNKLCIQKFSLWPMNAAQQQLAEGLTTTWHGCCEVEKDNHCCSSFDKLSIKLCQLSKVIASARFLNFRFQLDY